ncbi:hypothetical protein P691DRAFT_690636 [Macrolepiota fuliginosa MF-IS2]|uniref:Major facilitator superfamily (MFS) profile domain-containing protein n=1 Tax=Macrolepiota fuliginosa MF-IS2 TaxID=1400762 RepID=A0A9P6BVK7_9AGAR|nr:hypothetical protein P691DRAFT_690636 [Macrolepiota fuliginosa MF-IS2]
MLLSAYLSDKYQNHAIPSAIISTLAVAGFALYLHSTFKFIAYGLLFLTVPGVYAGAPIIVVWMANNSEPYFHHATIIALGFVAMNAGGILSTWRFPTKEGPRFMKMMIMDLTFSVLAIVLVFINVAVLHYKNWQKLLKAEHASA